METTPYLTPEDADLVARVSLDDPVFYVREILGGDPWSKQEDVLYSIRDHRRTGVRSCHGVGKTKCAAWVALWFLITHPNSVVITTAPTWHQVENLLWREIRNAHALARMPLGGKCLTVKLDLDDKWFALGMSTDKPERFQGFHAESGDILLIVDEASGVAQDIYDAAEGFLTSEGSRLLLIGNPTQLSGEFYTAFRSPIYHKIHISAWDSPNLKAGKVIRPYLITPEWVEEKRIKWGEDSPMWYSRVMGEFPEQGEDTLIPLAWVEAAQNRYLDPAITEAACKPGVTIRLGVDVARFGSDASVIMVSAGPRVNIVKVIRKQDTMAIAGAVIQAFRETGAHAANIDVIGIGAGVVDRLTEQHFNVTGVNVGDRAVDNDRYINLRAELYWLLREEFRDAAIAIPPDEDLAAELASMKYAFDSRGRIKIESKDDMRKRGISSPDRADAVMLARAETAPMITVAVGPARTQMQTYKPR
jgi:hypothetical protein